jgi:hypothetical protein
LIKLVARKTGGDLRHLANAKSLCRRRSRSDRRRLHWRVPANPNTWVQVSRKVGLRNTGARTGETSQRGHIASCVQSLLRSDRICKPTTGRRTLCRCRKLPKILINILIRRCLKTGLLVKAAHQAAGNCAGHATRQTSSHRIISFARGASGGAARYATGHSAGQSACCRCIGSRGSSRIHTGATTQATRRSGNCSKT